MLVSNCKKVKRRKEMKKLVVMAAAVAMLMGYGCSGCGSQKNDAAQADSLAAVAKADSLAAAQMAAEMQLPYGVYKGTMPCADCPGVEVVLVLSTDGSTLSTLYKERDTEPTVIAGAASFDAEGRLVFTPNDTNEEVTLYAVEVNTLRRLGSDGQAVTGELADAYVLTKE